MEDKNLTNPDESVENETLEEKDTEKTDEVFEDEKNLSEDVIITKSFIEKKEKNLLKNFFKDKRNIIDMVLVLIVVVLSLIHLETLRRNNEFENELNSEKLEKKEIQISLDKNKKDLEMLKKEYNDYKDKMQPYENLQKSDLEKRLKEAKEAEEKKKAEEEAKKQAEEKVKKEEEAKGYDTGITYENLARTPNDYKGKKVKFKGEVIQVIRGTTVDEYRIKVEDDYKKVLYVTYINLTGTNILEEDKVILMGISEGEITYKSTMGGNITIPSVRAKSIEVIK
ncbi:MAG: hypothetical protein PT934_03240 [Peptoniphilaceae bacterium]|uniref:hypothetical protein n=1 Tax=Parvimonas sp. TaxID=1944660 RepID=UPI0025D8AC70|nr:hypothetical protein [Parvimonas sp.]MCI5997391.1 hypothetical protein [Parvimonas sp.]MDD7764767.1 hypothetical protein [Peptoniphilaceae bacterium]MDY3050763.1 hypothetical protein [Parvimonas sp.]